VPLHFPLRFPVEVPVRGGNARARDTACRCLNVAVALAGIVVASPLMAVIAVLIKITSRGPVLYTQVRVGLNRRARRATGRSGSRDDEPAGRPFTIYKFRTMRAAISTPQVWARPDDPRITPIGRALRRFRLDELPQLFNVVRGDMNVVGPRPEQPNIAARLKFQVAGYVARHLVRPGITGLAQVELPYDQNLDDVRRKVALDLEYVRHRSPLQDLRIMVRTPMVMLGRRGAL
jgi:lipopolysaccharide/colanic/teichoic acid biosynthesis glycosyltransferase